LNRCLGGPSVGHPGGACPLAPARAFTLIELMLVMALLVIAMGIVYPALSGFFRGRHIEGEARRLVGLTRFAQSQAISTGIPMQLWIDLQTMSYGLQAYPGYLESDPFPQTYVLEQNLELELPSGAGYLAAVMPAGSPYADMTYSSPLGETTATGVSMLGRSMSGGALGTSLLGSQPSIAFRPDGSLMESSLPQIVVRDKETEEELWIVRNPARLTYEIVRPPNR
jgi:prepilin-type N-terminal cleavage/methylation domain-containing protein